MKKKKTLQQNIMKLLFAGGFSLLNVNFNFLPNVTLLYVLGFVIALDFVTGIAKAKFNGVARTSSGYRRTIKKFVQYIPAIACGAVLSYVSRLEGGEGVKAISGFLNNGLLIFIVYIEVTSIFENLYEIDSNSMISKYFYAPVLKILTFQIKNNPVIKTAEAIKEETKN